MFTFSKFEDKRERLKWFRPFQLPVSTDYAVKVNGLEVPVYGCRITKYPFNRSWPGFQRPYEQSVDASYINLISDETLTVEVTVKRAYRKAMLKPYSKNLKLNVCGDTVTFTLRENGNFILALDDYQHCLYVFNHKRVPCENPQAVTHYFGAGIHNAGKIVLKDNESVYLEKDAYVFGCVFAENAKNIRVYGNGVFDDGCEARIAGSCYHPYYTNGNIKFFDCENVSVEGVGFKDSAIFCVNVFHSKNVVLDGIKVFGQWRYNTDGVDIVNSQNVTLKNSFIHSFDDTVTVKGIEAYRDTDNLHILIENCTLVCDWGRACEIGLETNCKLYDDITFRNCDVLHGGFAAMDIQNGDYAEVRNIRFEDIRIEYEKFHRPEIQQRKEDDVYTGVNDTIFSYLLNVTNLRSPCNAVKIDAEKMGLPAAQVHDIFLKDIAVYYDDTIPLKEGKRQIPVQVENLVNGVTHYNIFIENVTVNGEKYTKDDALLYLDSVENFVWKE